MNCARRTLRTGIIVLSVWSLAMGEPARAQTGTFNLPPGPPPPTMRAMFDTITAELTTATDKLAHLRRFL